MIFFCLILLLFASTTFNIGLFFILPMASLRLLFWINRDNIYIMRNTSKSFFLIALFCVFCSNSLVANAVYLEKFDRPIVDVFNDLAKFLLSIAGGIALLVIIIAGVYYIASAGSSERQEKAKKMIRNCLFGLVIVLVSYGMIVTISRITTNQTIQLLAPVLFQIPVPQERYLQ